MFKRIKLTREEKRVIKKITKIQIKNLQEILNRECEEDISLWALLEDVNEEELMEEVSNSLKNFEEIKKYPRRLFNLEEDELSIAKHIMFNFANHPKYEDGKKVVWRKLIIIERFPINSN